MIRHDNYAGHQILTHVEEVSRLESSELPLGTI